MTKKKGQVSMVTEKSPVSMVTEKSPVSMVTEKSPVSMVTEIVYIKWWQKKGQVSMVTEKSPVRWWQTKVNFQWCQKNSRFNGARRSLFSMGWDAILTSDQVSDCVKSSPTVRGGRGVVLGAFKTRLGKHRVQILDVLF